MHGLIQLQGTIRVPSTGGGQGGGGRFSPNTPASSPNFYQLSLTKSYNNVLAKNLFAISQLQGPQNCLRMPQKAQIPKHSGGACPQTPLENCGLCLQTHYRFQHLPPPPKPKILDRTLALYYRWANIIFSRFPVPAMHGNMTFPSLYSLEMPRY